MNKIVLIISLSFLMVFESFSQVQGEHYVDGPMVGSLTDSSTSVNFILGKRNQSNILHVKLKNVTQNLAVTSEAYIHNTSSFLEQENKKLKLYPSPSTFTITIEVGDKFLNEKYTIVDVNGKVALCGVIQSNSQVLNISELSAGLYNFIVNSETGKKAQLFQKVD